MPDHHWLDSATILAILAKVAYASIALLGGIARYAERYTSGEPFTLSKLIAQCALSVFSGLIFASLADVIGLTGHSAFALAGLGGFMGTKGLDYIFARLAVKADASPAVVEKQ